SRREERRAREIRRTCPQSATSPYANPLQEPAELRDSAPEPPARESWGPPLQPAATPQRAEPAALHGAPPHEPARWLLVSRGLSRRHARAQIRQCRARSENRSALSALSGS